MYRAAGSGRRELDETHVIAHTLIHVDLEPHLCIKGYRSIRVANRHRNHFKCHVHDLALFVRSIDGFPEHSINETVGHPVRAEVRISPWRTTIEQNRFLSISFYRRPR